MKYHLLSKKQLYVPLAENAQEVTVLPLLNILQRILFLTMYVPAMDILQARVNPRANLTAMMTQAIVVQVRITVHQARMILLNPEIAPTMVLPETEALVDPMNLAAALTIVDLPAVTARLPETEAATHLPVIVVPLEIPVPNSMQ